MHVQHAKAALRRSVSVLAAAAFTLVLLFAVTPVGYCDDSYSMAPPVSADTPSDSSAVFNWQDIPADQEVPITRAVFDEGGYQLYDTVGETIVVPFKNQNLYVMKFGVSHTGSIYFVNTGSTPILYVPRHGYLLNETVPGARWYPFTDSFDPATPVYVGVAPSWSVFIGIGWYPDMCCYGGYWCGAQFGYFTPCFGLFISFGGHDFHGWAPYRDYANHYHAPYRLGYFHPGVYHEAARFGGGARSFHGSAGHGSAGGFHSFGGAAAHGRSYGNSESHSAGQFHGTMSGHSYQGSAEHPVAAAHEFRGATESHGASSAGRPESFGGTEHSFNGGSHSFGGAATTHSFGGGGGGDFHGGGGGGGFHGGGGGGGFHGGGGGGSHGGGGGGGGGHHH